MRLIFSFIILLLTQNLYAGYIPTSEKEETDPVYTAWDKSSGISITESQVSDLKDYLTSIPYTTVSPGSYTLSSITVGLDGRLTSASSGSEIDPIFSNSEAFFFRDW